MKNKKVIKFSTLHAINAFMRFTALYLFAMLFLNMIFGPSMQVDLLFMFLNPLYMIVACVEFYMGGRRGALAEEKEE